MKFILYTYQTSQGTFLCHAYAVADQGSGETEGLRLQKEAADAGQPILGFMVLPVETLPA